MPCVAFAGLADVGSAVDVGEIAGVGEIEDVGVTVPGETKLLVDADVTGVDAEEVVGFVPR